MKKKILIVFGTRPEAIKMAPLIKKFDNYHELFDVKVCNTGQHREMVDDILKFFGIRPFADLDIMQQDQSLFNLFSRVLTGMQKVLQEADPEIVFVQGDTITSTAAAMASFFLKIRVAHVEAGLRTFNPYSPWPEEMSRQLTGRLATYHFAPTLLAKQNLIKENIPEEKIAVTGNTVIDALFEVVEKIKSDDKVRSSLTKTILDHGFNIERLNNGRKLVLITGHRRENFGEGFINICNAIKVLSQRFKEHDFVYPVHLNPNVRNVVYNLLGSESHENIFLINPLAYLPFIFLMYNSHIILTDSGGIQEEAPSLGKPVLVLRDTTERPEALQAGTVKLVGTDEEQIIKSVSDILQDENHYKLMATRINPYGDGTASKKIIETLMNWEKLK